MASSATSTMASPMTPFIMLVNAVLDKHVLSHRASRVTIEVPEPPDVSSARKAREFCRLLPSGPLMPVKKSRSRPQLAHVKVQLLSYPRWSETECRFFTPGGKQETGGVI